MLPHDASTVNPVERVAKTPMSKGGARRVWREVASGARAGGQKASKRTHDRRRDSHPSRDRSGRVLAPIIAEGVRHFVPVPEVMILSVWTTTR
jgi:hypothetical protein